MAEVDKSEKITVNVGMVDLGQIDLLVNEGFYANRTDFIRTAIRRQLESRSTAVNRTIARRALVLGPLLFSAGRSLLPLSIVLPMAMLGGARFQDPLGFFTLLIAAIGVAVVSGMWGLGVAYRTRNQRSGALTQVGIFVAMFLTTGQVPLGAMTGWLHGVARFNPATNVLALAREGFVGEVTWHDTWPGLLALAGAGALLGVFTWRGFRKLVP